MRLEYFERFRQVEGASIFKHKIIEYLNSHTDSIDNLEVYLLRNRLRAQSLSPTKYSKMEDWAGAFSRPGPSFPEP